MFGLAAITQKVPYGEILDLWIWNVSHEAARSLETCGLV